MASPEIEKKHELNRDLYRALMEGDGETVIKLCQKIPEGPLHTLTIHNDTVLHMATYSKQKQLVLDLLKQSNDKDSSKMLAENDIGNTILHEAATSNRIVRAAKEMLRKAPRLLKMRNRKGETALFRAARYGKMEIFKFLDGEVNGFCKTQGPDEEERRREFYQRDDDTTILHISILTDHFDLALHIATEHESLLSAKDGDEMTALQLLACSPSAFKDRHKRRYLMWFINSCVSTQDTPVTDEVESGCRVPFWEAIRAKKQRYESALKLAKYLITKDTSWEETASAMDDSKPKTHKYGSAPSSSTSSGTGASSFPSHGQEVGDEDQKSSVSGQEMSKVVKIAETPLFLATKTGSLEIVEEILDKYPQAVEHIDHEGRNILHVAIKYRQIHIFDFVEKMEIPMMRLIRKINNDGNSILHMVGTKDELGAEDMRSPALVLQEELLLFERLENISTAHFIEHFNNEGLTAEKLFAKNNTQLRSDAKEWLKRTAENCSIVAVLIATVAFAAAYTVPGGPNQNTGYPILLNQSFFMIFTLTDVLSLTFALTAVITFLSILTSSFQFKDFKRSLPQKLMLGVSLLILSVSMMMLAFAATVILLIRNKQQWIRIALYSVAFFPVCIFALSYLPLYVELMKAFMYSLKKLGEVFPQFHGVSLRSLVAKSSSSCKNQSPDLSNPTHYTV